MYVLLWNDFLSSLEKSSNRGAGWCWIPTINIRMVKNIAWKGSLSFVFMSGDMGTRFKLLLVIMVWTALLGLDSLPMKIVRDKGAPGLRSMYTWVSTIHPQPQGQGTLHCDQILNTWPWKIDICTKSGDNLNILMSHWEEPGPRQQLWRPRMKVVRSIVTTLKYCPRICPKDLSNQRIPDARKFQPQ